MCTTGGLVTGIAVGALLSAVYFTFSYARMHVSSPASVSSLSGAVRTAGERDALQSFAPRMAVVSLSGYIMFGSAVHVRDRVLQVRNSVLLLLLGAVLENKVVTFDRTDYEKFTVWNLNMVCGKRCARRWRASLVLLVGKVNSPGCSVELISTV